MSAPAAPAPVLLGGRRLLGALGAWLLVSAAVAGGSALVARAVAGGAAPVPEVLVPVLVAEVYALLPATLWLVVRPHLREAAAISRCSTVDVARALGACAVAYAGTWALTVVLAPRSWAAALTVLQGMGSDDGRLAGAGPMLRGVILVRACLLAPVGEEMLFRGVLHTWLRQRVPAWVTIALTAVAFAMIHGFPAILPLAFAIGVGFGWVRERTRSIVPTVVAHALHNLIMVSASYALTGWTARLPAWGAG